MGRGEGHNHGLGFSVATTDYRFLQEMNRICTELGWLNMAFWPAGGRITPEKNTCLTRAVCVHVVS